MAIYGSPTSPISDYFTEVARGNVNGQSVITKFGNNPDIDSDFEAIWNGGDAYTGHNATGAETVEVFSADANDDAAGTGARTVELFGLDGSYDEINETVSMDGATPVDTVNSYLRLNRMIVRTAGSGLKNAGEITARQKVTTANIFAVMPAEYNQTMIAAYTIPNGKTAYMLTWFAALSGRTTSTSLVRLRFRPLNEVFQVKEELSLNSSGVSYVKRDYPLGKGTIAAKTDLFVEADTDTVNSGVAAGFDLLLIDD